MNFWGCWEDHLDHNLAGTFDNLHNVSYRYSTCILMENWGAICQFVHHFKLLELCRPSQDDLQNQVTLLKPFGVLWFFKLVKSRPLGVKDWSTEG